MNPIWSFAIGNVTASFLLATVLVAAIVLVLGWAVQGIHRTGLFSEDTAGFFVVAGTSERTSDECPGPEKPSQRAIATPPDRLVSPVSEARRASARGAERPGTKRSG